MAAIATAPGRGAVGIVRVSGPGSGRIAEFMAGAVPPPRRAVRAVFPDENGEPIDDGLVLWFPGPASYTGEDLLELHGHGGVTVLSLVLRRCVALGARLAEPGEFTRRAFLNGKLDLAQAEAVADLIDASTQAGARAAMRSLEGTFSNQINSLNEEMTTLRALVEAAIDFPEEDIDVLSRYDVVSRVSSLRTNLMELSRLAGQGRLLREGVTVALVGRPNVGKSSLLNRLAGEAVAIVTDVPGTTRDTIRASVALEGVPFHFIDTAGLRESADPVEQIGMERTRAAAGTADVVVAVGESPAGWSSDDQRMLESITIGETTRVVFAANKADLGLGGVGWPSPPVHLSAHSGIGFDVLHAALLDAAGWTDLAEEGVFMARARHVAALQSALYSVERALTTEGGQVDLIAEELRHAQRALGTITGAFSADDLLGVIFSRFCLGK
ncbi:MAG: tRNA uridine-5-carboxymethylaminomethyl(34) synthesis GTPase MnmE [Burkholderiales bacterium]|nr:tRNA uridine-5-carboxymethylaminomethyl(34) synthesis GTPase MnmE [Burkholderiales bacterium]